jgi:hypothetical protein
MFHVSDHKHIEAVGWVLLRYLKDTMLQVAGEPKRILEDLPVIHARYQGTNDADLIPKSESFLLSFVPEYALRRLYQFPKSLRADLSHLFQ